MYLLVPWQAVCLLPLPDSTAYTKCAMPGSVRAPVPGPQSTVYSKVLKGRALDHGPPFGDNHARAKNRLPIWNSPCGVQCPKTRWRSCTACQQRIQDEALEDEYELQSWFIRRINRFLAGQGKQLIGWDEILEGGLAEGACLMSWRVRTVTQGCACVSAAYTL